MEPDDDILDIAEAAAFLRVSETSLRRWTNAGVLRCFRIGGRRERRFLRSDLVEYLSRPVAPVAEGHGHACALYTTPAERERLAGEFLAGGLDAGSTCFLVGDPAARKDTLAWLARHGRAGFVGDRAGPLFLGRYGESPTEQLNDWSRSFTWATGTGRPSIHAVGDVTGAPFARLLPFDDVIEYEREYDRSLAARFPVATLCLYDARRLSGVEAARVVQAHGGRAR